MEQSRTKIGGIALFTLGVLLILGRSFGGSDFSWPLFVLVPGLLLVGAAVWEEKLTVLALPGSVISAVGSILFLQNITGAFETWAYAWALLVAALGVGQVIRKAPTPSPGGTRLLRLGLILFAAFGAFFELFIFGDALTNPVLRFLGPLVLIGAGGLLLTQARDTHSKDPLADA